MLSDFTKHRPYFENKRPSRVKMEVLAKGQASKLLFKGQMGPLIFLNMKTEGLCSIDDKGVFWKIRSDFYFQIRNKDRSMCIDANTDTAGGRSQPVSVYPCHGQGGNQVNKTRQWIRLVIFCKIKPENLLSGTMLEIRN